MTDATAHINGSPAAANPPPPPSVDDQVAELIDQMDKMAAADLSLLPFRRLLPSLARAYLTWETGERTRNTKGEDALEAIIRSMGWLLIKASTDGEAAPRRNVFNVAALGGKVIGAAGMMVLPVPRK